LKEASHTRITELAFDLLREINSSFSLFGAKPVVAYSSMATDSRNDLEFVDVEGGLTGHGRDDPHVDEWDAIDDQPHYSEKGRNLTTFNHFIDIRKGPGRFDDFDGYSYRYGSASVGEHQTAADAASSWWEQLFAFFLGKKVDAGINWWFNDEYVHAPGHRWYRGCSPAIGMYSYYGEKGIYPSLEEEAKARFPRAKSVGATGMGIPYSVFMPIDNMARYWFSRFKKDGVPEDLGYVMHAVQDASIPHHAAGCCGNWHGEYEAKIATKINNWSTNSGFRNETKALFNQWNTNDSQPPTQLSVNDWSKTPHRNWRIDMLVTWLALNANHAYSTVYNSFNGGESFNDANAYELTKKATALSMLALSEASNIFDLEDCIGLDYQNAEVKKINGRWKIVIGNVWYKDFNDKESEARLGLQIIKFYKMDSQCFIGRPDPSMEYYKSKGNAPRAQSGQVPGEDCVTFDPNAIELKKIQGNWKIVQGNHWLMDFDDKELEARKALAIIKKYKFTHYCFVGRPGASMEYFRLGPVSPGRVAIPLLPITAIPPRTLPRITPH